MSREIDERVVQMKFDNTQFERETSRTMNTLQKLKASLNFTGVAKGFGSIASDTNIIHKNMQVLQGGVASVKREFSSLEVIGATCLVNLTNSAIRTGKMITNALTLEPVKTGFQEYETKMGAIQTIMTNTASKGTTMEQVIDVIDELNTYADKTIYNFAEMTRNIGTFTAAGVGLEDAASAIQGIANLAAASGSNSQQASTAMYQLSQALAAGTVKLMDWNSVVNAGMGGELFQNALKDTAREMGITVDEIIEKQGSFRESLSEGWLTADVLNTTLRKLTVEGAQQYADEMMACGKYTQEMSDSLLDQARNAEDAATKVKTFTQLWDTLKETAQSGWGKTWELLVGNFDQAKNLFTELNDRFSPLIDKFSDARNNLIETALGRPSKWNEIIKVVNKAGITTEQFEAKIKENMSELNINIDEQISQYGSLEGWITGCAIGTDVLKNSIKDLTGEQRRHINLTQEDKHTLEEWQDVVDAVWRGDFKNAPERYDLLADAEWDYVKVQELVNSTVDGHRLTVEELTAAQLLECAATDEQKKKLQAIINKMDESGESMDDIINSLYKPKEGRDLLIQSLYNVLDAIGSVIKPIGQAFKDAFSPLTADNVYSFLEALEKFTRQLILTDEQSANLKNVLQILLTVLDGIRFVVGTVLRFAFAALSEILKGMNMNVSDFTGSIAEATTKARDWIKTHDLVNVAITKLGPTLQSIGKFIDKWTDKLTNSENIPKDIAGAFTEGFGEAKTVLKGFFDDIWKIFGDSINNLFDKIGVTPVVEKMKSIYSGISDEVSDEVTRGGESESKPFVAVLFKAFSSTISDQLDTLLPMITETISKVMGWIEKNVDPGMVVGGYFLMSAHDTLKSVIEVADKLASPMEKLGEMFESVGGVFEQFSANLKAARFTTNATGIFLIAGAIAALAGALVIISRIPKDRLEESRDTLFGLIVLTGAMMALVGKIMVINKESQSLNLAAVMGVVVGLIAIVMAIKVLGNMDVHAMWQGIQGTGVCVLMLIALIGSVMLLTDLCKGVEITGLGGFMVGFGLALLSMIATVKIASSMDKSTMKKGLAFVAGCTLLLTYLLLAASTFTGKGGLGAAAVLAVAGLTFATMIGVVMIAAQISMKDLKHGMKVVAGIEVLLLGLMFISKLGGGVKGAAALVMMSTSALIMVEVIKMVNKVTPDELAKGLAFMTYMGYIFAGFVIATALAGKNAHKGGVALLAFSAACLVMVGVCKLMGMLKEEELKKGLAAIVVLGITMALILTSTRGAEECHKNILAVAAVMFTLTAMMFVMYALAGNKERFIMATSGIVLLMYGLYAIMKKGGTIKDENVKALKKVLTSIAVLLVIVAGIILLMEKMGIEKAEANANALKGLLGIIGLCILAISKSVDGIKKFDLPALAKLGGIMLVLIGAMALLAVLLKLMGDAGVGPVSMKLIGEMAALMIVLVGCAAAMGAITRVVNSKGILGTIVVLAAMTAVMYAVAIIIDKLSLIENVNGILTKVAAVSILMGVLTVCAAAMSLLGNLAVNIEGLIAAAVVIVVMTAIMMFVEAIVAELSKIQNVEGMMTKVAAVAALLGALTLCAAILTVVGNAGINVVGIAAAAAIFAEMALILPSIASVVAELSKIESTDGIIQSALATALLMFALTICANMITLFARFVDPIGVKVAEGTLAAMVTLLPTIAAIISSMDGINGKNAFDNALALSTTLLALAVACVILSEVGIFAGAAMKGIEAFNELGDVIIQLIGKFIDDIGPKLVTFGENLAKFSGYMMIFGMNMQTVNQKAVESCVLAAEMLTAIIGAAVLDDIMTKFGGASWIDVVGDKLTTFGDAIIAFSNQISGSIDSGAVTAAAKAGEMLASLESSLGSKPEWLTKYIGDDDMGKFGTRLTSFAEGMNAFAATLTENGEAINEDDVQNFCDAVMPLVELAHEIPNEGGWLGRILGENNIDEFAKRLPNFATSIKTFLFRIKDYTFDPDTVKNFADCVKPLVKIAKDVPNCGGKLAELIGDNNLDSFGKQLPKLGEGLRDFYDAINDGKTRNWNPDTFTALADCMTPILSIAKSFDGQAEWTKTVFGDNSLSSLGTELSGLAPGVTAIGTALQGASVLRSERGVTMVTHLKSMMEAMPSTTAIGAFVKQVNKMTENDMGTKLTSLGGMLKGFSDSLEGANVSNISDAGAALSLLTNSLASTGSIDYDGVSQFGETLKTLGSDVITSFSTSITEGYDTINGAFADLVTDIVDKFSYKLYNFKMMGWHIIDKICEGIEDRKDNVWNKLKEVYDDTIGNANAYNDNMKYVGENIINGLVNGMDSKLNDLRNKCNEVGTIVGGTIGGSLEVESPSKVTTRIGEFVGIGLINGMTSTLSGISVAAGQLGDTTAETLGGAIAQTVEAFENEDINPTITPVLDLSEVTDGMNSIDNMFTTAKVNTNRLNGMGRNVDGTTNSDLLSAINTLNETLSNLEMNNYHIDSIEYEDGSNVANAINQLVVAANIAKR